jgi:hypothetical protein
MTNAAYYGHLEVLKLLQDQGADLNLLLKVSRRFKVPLVNIILYS